MRLLILICTIFCAFQSISQTIVNTEKLFDEDSTKFKYSTELMGSFITGNTSILFLEYSANGSYQKGKSQFMLLTGGEYINEQKQIISNSHYGQFRYVYHLSRWFSPFLFYQIQSNDILLLQRRQLVGIGSKAKLFQMNRKDSTELFSGKLGIGVMLEEELLNRVDLPIDEQFYTFYPRASFSWMMFLKVNEVFSIINTSYFQPYLADFTDFRYMNETNLLFELTDKLSFSIDIEIRYDNRPPSILKNTDINSNFGILLQL